MTGIDGQTVILWRLPLLPTTACSKLVKIYDDDVLDADAIHEYNYVSLTKLAEVYLDTQWGIKFDS